MTKCFSSISIWKIYIHFFEKLCVSVCTPHFIAKNNKLKQCSICVFVYLHTHNINDAHLALCMRFFDDELLLAPFLFYIHIQNPTKKKRFFKNDYLSRALFKKFKKPTYKKIEFTKRINFGPPHIKSVRGTACVRNLQPVWGCFLVCAVSRLDAI